MLYLIGLGLDEKGFSFQTYETLKKCRKIYLENYTVEIPYKKEKLEKLIGKKILIADRKFVEEGIKDVINQSKKGKIAILVYGSPLTATTHISLIEELRKSKVNYKIIHNASIFDAIAETGLQLYKFGKVASMPKWEKNFKPESFIEIIKENQSIKAHSLILIDIGLKFKESLKQLKISAKDKININKIVVCSRLGNKDSKIFYENISILEKKEIKVPFCIIIPAKELHFMEEEFLESYAS